MANLRMTFGTAMTTVSDVLNSVSTATNVVTNSIGMLDAFVTDAAKNQQFRLAMEQSSTRERILNETTLLDTERQLKIKKYLSDNPDAVEIFKANQARLEKVMESIK